MADDGLLRFHVSLPSGRCEVVSLSSGSTIGDLKLAAQQALARGFLRLAGPDGRVLELGDTVEGAGLGDGDSITAVAWRTRLAATQRAFALWGVGSDSVTWGPGIFGGDSRRVASQLVKVQEIFATDGAFAAMAARVPSTPPRRKLSQAMTVTPAPISPVPGRRAKSATSPSVPCRRAMKSTPASPQQNVLRRAQLTSPLVSHALEAMASPASPVPRRDRRAASLTSAHKARSPAKAARPRAQAKAEPRRPARGKARSDLSQSFSSASKAQWAEECSKEDRWDKAWELQEENRSLRALAERLQLQLAAVEESERRYQAELAGVDTETDEEDLC
ncbi:unnamed protein product [Effrenium voratum]|nr:unnamed protein product [Effrenium voratum]